MISSECRTHFSIIWDQSSLTSGLLTPATATATATARCSPKVVKNALMPSLQSRAGLSTGSSRLPNAASSASTTTDPTG